MHQNDMITSLLDSDTRSSYETVTVDIATSNKS